MRFSLDNNEFKHIVVTKENYEKLKERGKLGDTFNDVITRILEKSSLTGRSGS